MKKKSKGAASPGSGLAGRLGKKVRVLLFGAALPYWFSFLVLVAGAAGAILEPAPVVMVRNAAFDMLQRWRPREHQPAPVRILDIDDASLEKLGQWPWPRTQIAEMVARLQELGAAAIVFDVVFAEPDRTSPNRLLELWGDNPAVAEALGALPDHDQVLAQTIGRGRVVTGFSLGRTRSTDRQPAEKGRFITAGDDPRLFMRSFPGSVTTLPLIEAAAAGNGAFSFIADHDGVIRSVPLLMRSEDRLYPTLSSEALRVAQGASNFIIKSSGASGEERAGAHTGIVAMRIGGVEVATGPQGEVWLHYTPFRQDRYVPVWKLMDGSVDPALLAGHIVFIGPSAKGLMDLRFTPLGGIIPGVEVHAQLTEQLMQGSYLRRSDLSVAGSVIYLGLVWLLLILALSRFSALWSAVAGAAAVAGSIVFSGYLFSEMRILFDPLYPSLVIAAFFTAFSMPRHLQSEQKSKWIQDAFASYVSPNLVKHLVEHPDLLTLGGEQRECSFVMTDLAGFTSLMEKFDPNDMVTLLNKYLDEMVQIAFRLDGTLDRIVGDAVAIIFSAPVSQADHAARAVKCAIEMDRFSKAFALEQQAKGISFGMTRIGVNTGTVLVGNFGGETMLDYRALGDAINTAARLESVNKQLGTLVCVSGATVAQVPDFVGRPSGALVLKGKSEAIETYELMDSERFQSPPIQAYVAAYKRMADEDPGALTAFRELASEYPEDGLAKFHLARLEAGETGARVVLSSK